jgi:hypothetical protein
MLVGVSALPLNHSYIALASFLTVLHFLSIPRSFALCKLASIYLSVPFLCSNHITFLYFLIALRLASVLYFVSLLIFVVWL